MAAGREVNCKVICVIDLQRRMLSQAVLPGGWSETVTRKARVVPAAAMAVCYQGQ